MDDLEWLATRTGRLALGGATLEASARHRAGVVVEPSRVRSAARVGTPVVAVVGLPDGRHDSVIKAMEARLAVDSGAAEVWLVLDADARGLNELLADAVAVRQAVEAPAKLGLVYAGLPDVVKAGELVGVDTLACDGTRPLPRTTLDIAAYGVADTQDAVIGALEAGAAVVFPAA